MLEAVPSLTLVLLSRHWEENPLSWCTAYFCGSTVDKSILDIVRELSPDKSL